MLIPDAPHHFSMPESDRRKVIRAAKKQWREDMKFRLADDADERYCTWWRIISLPFAIFGVCIVSVFVFPDNPFEHSLVDCFNDALSDAWKGVYDE